VNTLTLNPTTANVKVVKMVISNARKAGKTWRPEKKAKN
jgi:hypothetical protein